MLLGVLLGVAAGALWGLIYIAPLAVPEYNPVLVALRSPSSGSSAEN